MLLLYSLNDFQSIILDFSKLHSNELYFISLKNMSSPVASLTLKQWKYHLLPRKSKLSSDLVGAKKEKVEG